MKKRAMADITDEPWFIGVMAGVGAFVLILVIVIVILCCYWIRLMKKADKQREVSSNNQEMGNTNWTLVDSTVTAPPTTSTARVIRGDDPAKAGSSLLYINKEMRAHSVNMGTQTAETSVEQSMGGSQYIETTSFTRNGSVSQMSDRSSASSSKFVRSESRESYQKPEGGSRYIETTSFTKNGSVSQMSDRSSASSSKFIHSESRESYQKPRIANLSVTSSVRRNENAYQSLNQNTANANASTAVVGSPYSYRIPNEDYETSGIVMYTTEEQRGHARAHIRKISATTSVKEIATTYERQDSVTSPSSKTSRSELDDEIKELKDTERTAVIKRRLSERQNSRGNLQANRVSNSSIQEHINEGGMGSASYESQSSWAVSGGQNTIETRVNRIKKVGAVSVFPD